VGRTQTTRQYKLGASQNFLSLARVSLEASLRGVLPGCSNGIKPLFVMKFTDKLSSLRTLQRSLAAVVGAILFVGVSSAQSPQVDDPASLEAARMALATTDFDMDGLISKEEAEAAGVPEREFVERDKDKSGSWTGEEFLLYYHGLLKNSGKQPDEAFEDEVTRIEAVRRAQEEELRRAAERLRKLKAREEAAAKARAAQEAAGESSEAESKEESIEQKLRRAREALKDRSKRADSDREAFERKAGELAERARGASGESDSVELTDDEWANKLRRARAALERRAKEGRWSREQLEAADLRLIERARAAEQGVDLTQLPAPVRSKYERALVALTERAQSGGWSREQYEAELADLLKRAKDELKGESESEVEGEVSSGGKTQSRRTYERALAALDERAVAGGWSRERYEAERAALAGRLKIREAGGGAGGDAEAPVGGVRDKVERAKGALDDRARRAGMGRDQHKQISEELYKRARSSMNTELLCLWEEDPLRTKHERAMEALIQRAQRAEMTRGAFEAERDQLLQRARSAVEQRQGEGEPSGPKATQADFNVALANFSAVAGDLNSEARAKHQRAMNALIARAQKAGMSREAFERERDELLKRAQLEARAGVVQEADFDVALTRLSAVSGGLGSEARAKHQRAMNALIARAQKAGMSREAFERERDELLKRAQREARSGG